MDPSNWMHQALICPNERCSVVGRKFRVQFERFQKQIEGFYHLNQRAPSPLSG